MKTVFYAWQSDSPGATNRNFLEDCLERAIGIANRTRSAAERLVLDKDTQGEAGMPVVAEVVFRKIDECAVFVPDLSFVARTETGKPLPNANVSIELGHALGTEGGNRIVGLFNEEFGSCEQLPFDLRHRRWPLRYSLAMDAVVDGRRTVREALVARLVDALVTAADYETVGDVPESPPVAATSLGLGSFDFPSPWLIDDGRLIARVSRSVPGADADGKLFWHNAPHAYIDVRAAQPTPTATYEQLCRRIQKPSFRLVAFGERCGTWDSRNSEGLVVGEVLNDERHANALCITQLYKLTGRLVGINQGVVAHVDNLAVMGAERVRSDFVSAVKSYLAFYALNPDLPAPLQLHCGFEMLSEVYLATSTIDGFAGPCVQSRVYHSVFDVALDADPYLLLRPLFVQLWDLMGVPYVE